MHNKPTITSRIQLEWLSRYRDAIYGACIVYIMLFHAYAIDKVDYSFGHSALRHFRTVMSNGSVGVDVFLLLSGIFLYYSFHNRSLQSFTKKRLIRIYIPLMIVDGAYWLIRYALIRGEILGFLTRIAAIKFFLDGDQSIWYVSFLLVCYMLYPAIYSFIYQDDAVRGIVLRTSVIMVFCWFAVYSLMIYNKSYYDLIEIAVTRMPAFILGCGAGKFVYEKKTLPVSFITAVIGTAVFFSILHFDILHSCYRRWFFLAGGVSFALTLAAGFSLLDKIKTGKVIISVFSYIGKSSLELYLTHIMINQIFRLTGAYTEGDLKGYLLYVMILSFPAAFLASHAGRILIRKADGATR